jgi:hypothetical protein
MDQLPRVLQNEIWEYVRGDRTYWKQQFNPILSIVKFINYRLLHQVCDLRKGQSLFGEVRSGIGDYDVSVFRGRGGRFFVSVNTLDGPRVQWLIEKEFADVNEATKEFDFQFESLIVARLKT